MANRRARSSSRPGANNRNKRSASSRQSQSNRRKIIAWIAGVLATVSAAILVAAIPGAAHAVFGLVGHHKASQGPIAISPTTPRANEKMPTVGEAAPEFSGMPPGGESYQQVEVQYYLPGAIPIKDLPAKFNPHKGTILPPTTSWTIDVNTLGNSSSPVIITGMSVHVISRAPEQPVTMVDSCWKDDCTPSLWPGPFAGAEVGPRYLRVNLDNPGSN